MHAYRQACNIDMLQCALYLHAGKQPVEVEINVREVIESREGFTFIAAGT